ncbi:MAG: hypothetical protein WB697_07815 [Stellaceae bacterium]
MALTLTRRRRIAPMEQEFERRPVRQPEPVVTRDDDYHVEGETIVENPSIGARVVHSLQILLILVVAILSAAIIWTLGVIFGIW